MRGDQGSDPLQEQKQRSIPASAGEPFLTVFSGFGTGVYPRECGGTNTQTYVTNQRAGLSPRVRGNRRACMPSEGAKRSIPASAGEPNHLRAIEKGIEVYPRECGGTSIRQPGKFEGAGLSPRVRGNRTTKPSETRRSGSIPASAGEPDHYENGNYVGWVYPRECGGTRSGRHLYKYLGGLSPRVRGNRLHSRPLTAWCRSIPASAGEPWQTSLVAARLPVYPRECGGTPASAGEPPSATWWKAT